jgi:hypothetical protein
MESIPSAMTLLTPQLESYLKSNLRIILSALICVHFAPENFGAAVDFSVLRVLRVFVVKFVLSGRHHDDLAGLIGLKSDLVCSLIFRLQQLVSQHLIEDSFQLTNTETADFLISG